MRERGGVSGREREGGEWERERGSVSGRERERGCE